MSTSRTAITFDHIERFNDAFNRHDVDAIMALMTNDSQAAVRAAWNALFSSPPSARFETEDLVACDDRRTVRWRSTWNDGHVRGVDIFRVRDGKVAEKLSCVKG